jgi:hypothetical protein
VVKEPDCEPGIQAELASVQHMFADRFFGVEVPILTGHVYIRVNQGRSESIAEKFQTAGPQCR